MFVKPRTMSRVAKHLGADWSVKGAPTGEEYGRVLAWSRELRAALEPVGAEDMIDVQSLLWTAGWQLGQAAPTKQEPVHVARYWKVAPREGAALWSDWLEHNRVTVGWDELGDLSELTPDEWPAHRDRVCGEYGWTTAGADQCWRFARDIAPGDRIVANRGTKGIVGFGTVEGEYYFVPDESEAHRMPVHWDDVRPRTLPEPNHGWQRTLLELKRQQFDDLLALPPDGSEALGPPFDKLFADRAEAEAALELMAEVLAALGVTTNDDARFAVTYSANTRRLTLDFGPWCMMRCWPVERVRRLQLALFERSGVLDDLPIDFRFKEADQDRPVVLRTMQPATLNDDIRSSSLDTAREAKALFGHRNSSNWRRYHIEEIGAALLDPTKCDTLLTNGLSGVSPEPEPTPIIEPVEHPAFSEEARDLLVAMDADPTKAFYAEHKESLTEHVQEPVRAFLKRIAARVSPQLRDSLEVEKRLFGVFNKNDYGKGGAWPFYWGAFYPLGGTKTRDCQLFVTLSADGFAYGFSIGNYASDNHKRFRKNINENRQALTAALGDTINAPEFHFGDANKSEGEKGAPGPPDLDLDGWFTSIESSGPQVHVDVAWDELLATEMPTLEARVTNAFDRLFPLMLLGTLDDPLPAVDEYLSSFTDDQHDEEDTNPAYTLDDLAAETSLPKENLERWLRAIERKGQAILYGPPGTGKTYVAERIAKHLVAGGTGVSELVQFHPAYAYEDFMQGIRPKARDGGGLDYPVVDGRFKQFCQQARGRKGLSVLIIDEVNRANLARVFGELMYLLEYRDKSIPLASGGTFSIPGNVRIIGTMNTADRSIALVDHALRRRFAFLPLYPDYQMLTDFHEKAGNDFDPAKLVGVLKELNRKIGDHHYEVGTSFFLRPDIEQQLPDVWAMEIEPYLEEYFFDQQATVEAYRWDEIKKKLDLD
jgi:5-methylcytosine-specific restriction protein B